MREVTEAATHASRTAEGRGLRRPNHLRGFIVATIAAPVMAVLAPLGTDAISFWGRLLYWLVLFEAGALFGTGASALMERWGRLRDRPWIEGAVATLLVAVPLTLIVAAARTIVFGLGAPSPRAWAIMFGLVCMISAVITAIAYGMDHAAKAGDASPAAALPEPDAGALFAERLPLPLRGLAILALEAEDHYLRVHLAGGQSTLILMRLTDAIAALAGVPGARTHRSWWVAKAAVTRVTKADGRAILTLTDGVEAPVSRSYYKTLADAGWLV